MSAGALRERIMIEKKSVGVDDGYGNHSAGWTNRLANPAPASIRPLRSRERIDSGGVDFETRYEISIRYSSAAAAATASDRITNTNTGEVYNLVSEPINLDQRRRFLTFYARKGRGNA